MAPPDDARDVLSALQLGWFLAEVRGRNRPDAPPGSGASMPDHADHALPLHIERGRTELRIEAQAAVLYLAQHLEVDTDTNKGSYGTNVDNEAKALQAARKQQKVSPSDNHQKAVSNDWQALANLLWEFDAHVQDALTAKSVTQAAAYQLGRGLAEAYWALDPGQANGSTGWTFLLGDSRCDELSRLVGRLSAYFDEYTASAVAGSIEVWRKVAANEKWRGDKGQASVQLYLQIRRWYELLILGQDPTTLIKPRQVIRNWRTIWRAVQYFWFQFLALIVGAVALGYLGFFLAENSQSSAAKVVAGVLSVVGLSLASITGYLKNSAQAMLKRLRQDAYTDLIAVAVQTAPPSPERLKGKVVRDAISNRMVTPQTPN